MIITLKPKDLYRILLKEEEVSFSMLADGTPHRDATNQCDFVLDLDNADALVTSFLTVSANHVKITISDGNTD